MGELVKTEAWTRFLEYAARALAKPEFEVEERDHRLDIAAALRSMLAGARDGSLELEAGLVTVFRGSYRGLYYELTLPHQNEWLKGWASADQPSLARALMGFLKVDEEAERRFAGFARSAEEAHAAGAIEADPNLVLAFGSLFNFALQPESLPVIRRAFFRRLERLLGGELEPANSVTDQYVHHVEFSRGVDARMRNEGIPTRDMVDTQSLMWLAAADHEVWTSNQSRASNAATVIGGCVELLKLRPADVTEEVSPRDCGHAQTPRRRYLRLGMLAIDCIRLVILCSSAWNREVRSILDLPSGHGRVLRFLKAEYPEAQLAACDIDRDAVDFCAATFGATPIYSDVHPQDVNLERQYDLIWCGSLLTHLDAPMWEEFLDLFESALSPGGVLVMTTHGRSVAASMREEKWLYMRNKEKREAILRSYGDRGFGYADYDLSDEERSSLSLPSSYGISLAQPSWVCGLLEARPQLQLVSYMENRWGGQDVVGCVRVA